MPIGLIVKIALCIVANHRGSQRKGAILWGADLDLLTKFLSQIDSQLPTAFTILFVTTMTTLLKRFALWRAQRGDASVATLEQYQASVSLPSTLKAALSLRAFTLRSLGLILVWCFYYLGSQASSREFTLVSSDPYEIFPVWVPKLNASQHFSNGVPPMDLATINSVLMKDLVTASTPSPGNLPRYDLRGNPFVPTLDSLLTKRDKTPFDDDQLFKSFLKNLALSTGLPPDNNTSSQLEYVWLGRDSVLAENTSLVNLTQSLRRPHGWSEELWGDGSFYASLLLQNAINTYYMLYLKQAVIFSDFSLLESDATDKRVLYDTVKQSGNWTVSWMHGAEYLPAYRMNVPWIVIDFISCSVLLTAAVVAALLRRQTLAPDIFGYVSSITRENPLIPLPDGGSSLSGMERARKTKDVKIHIADVSQHGEVGRLSLTVGSVQ
ncbi:hypothetical protein B0A49_05466 [Cryomyces minteri]|uniref:Transmembrane protein n=1 Tax=Cryomyces minteri TaxID=331657 RepID=A0A4V5NIS6_9PEZI|nr:hypothetical protein B0A49_05466 [Cryomyces minteri]